MARDGSKEGGRDEAQRRVVPPVARLLSLCLSSRLTYSDNIQKESWSTPSPAEVSDESLPPNFPSRFLSLFPPPVSMWYRLKPIRIHPKPAHLEQLNPRSTLQPSSYPHANPNENSLRSVWEKEREKRKTRVSDHLASGREPDAREARRGPRMSERTHKQIA